MSTTNLPKSQHYFDRTRGSTDPRLEVEQTIDPKQEIVTKALTEAEAAKIQEILKGAFENSKP